MIVREELESSPSQMDPRGHAEQKKESESREPSLRLTAVDTSPERVRGSSQVTLFLAELGTEIQSK